MTIKGDYLTIRWHIDDIIDYANEHFEDLNLTKSEAKSILINIDKNHDCNVGVNWDIIEFFINEFIENNTEY